MNRTKRIQFLQTILTKEEFNELYNDKKAFQEGLRIYDEHFIDSVEVFSHDTKNFLIPKKDQSKLPTTWKKILEQLSLHQELQNPIYVAVQANGTLSIE